MNIALAYKGGIVYHAHMKPYIPSIIAWFIALVMFAVVSSLVGSPQINTFREQYGALYWALLMICACCQFVSMFWGIIGIASRPRQRWDFTITLLLSSSSWILLIANAAYMAT